MNFKYVAMGFLCVFAGTYSCFGALADDTRFGPGFYGRSPYYDPLMGGMGFVDKNAGFVETLGIGFKTGLASSIVDSMRKSFDATIGSFVNKTTAAGSTVKKMILARLHNNNGLDVRECFGLGWVLGDSIKTHVSNAAQGARILRAKVLDQQVAEADAKPEALYGMSVVKKDMTYIVERLTAQRAYYKDNVIKTPKRSVGTQVLDSVAALGMGYVVIDSFMPAANEKNLVAQVNFWKGQLQDDVHSGAREMRITAEPSVPLILQAHNPLAQYHAEVVEPNITFYVEKLKQLQQLRGDYTKVAVKSALTLFALWRLYAWMHSDNAVQVADALCDVNRALIVHLIDTICGNLQHLIVLCDAIKQESDIARYKNEFEFVSKNCSDALLHIAYLIDREETMDVQRKGKPGQASAAYGQGYAGLGAGLPKF